MSNIAPWMRRSSENQNGKDESPQPQSKGMLGNSPAGVPGQFGPPQAMGMNMVPMMGGGGKPNELDKYGPGARVQQGPPQQGMGNFVMMVPVMGPGPMHMGMPMQPPPQQQTDQGPVSHKQGEARRDHPQEARRDRPQEVEEESRMSWINMALVL
eukprot:CAMPEP_0117836924 /NCGR_PEP_ID=MMETSP0949-20121206/12402_1 /TAXON_ID=44440 /ORGANISM="Chattonella subsalsa, Strain CCMP2191" /LENGTH=154 /DNA_ID=CAMNT_0005679261 /DNA_START=23 /DNA_END=484 /DNA_ORIENTATION=-